MEEEGAAAAGAASCCSAINGADEEEDDGRCSPVAAAVELPPSAAAAGSSSSCWLLGSVLLREMYSIGACAFFWQSCQRFFGKACVYNVRRSSVWISRSGVQSKRRLFGALQIP